MAQRQTRRWGCTIAALCAAVVILLLVALSVLVGRSSQPWIGDEDQPAAAASAAPTWKCHGLDEAALNDIIHKEMSPQQHAASYPVCDNDWVYMNVEGGRERTSILVHWNGAKWVVEHKGGSGKLVTGEDPVCSQVPDDIKRVTCIG